MTRDQAATRIRQNLDDLGVTFYSLSDINESIQDAYDEVVVYCGCLDSEVEINFANNLTYYDIRTLVPNFYRVSKIWHPGINGFYGLSNDRNELSYRNNWELSSNVSREALVAGPNRIGMVGRSANATGFFRLFYKTTAPVLSANTVILINEGYIRLIELYGTADLLEQNEEFTKASKLWEEYEVMLSKYKQKVDLLSKSDRVFAREV